MTEEDAARWELMRTNVHLARVGQAEMSFQVWPGEPGWAHVYMIAPGVSKVPLFACVLATTEAANGAPDSESFQVVSVLTEKEMRAAIEKWVNRWMIPAGAES